MKKIASLLFAGAMALAAAPQTYVGLITDTMCGADHKHMNMGAPEKCVTECVKAGSKYALLAGKNMYTLSDQKTPEKFAGRKVKVTGTLYEKTKILKVDSIEASK